LTEPAFHTEFRSDQIHPTVFLAQGAVVVGDVTLAEETSVWFNATLRGDTTPITVGPRTNIQEGCILHADPGFPAILGAGVTVGHRAIIHGAKIGDNTLVGMGAILLNGVVVGENCVIGAGALLTQGKEFPPGSLILGAPAKVVREVTPEEIEQNRTAARTYVRRSRAFMASGK
jgi:carbonic anhydrase/acetyltransferase-like protein (isoleucine patch superfamily)